MVWQNKSAGDTVQVIPDLIKQIKHSRHMKDEKILIIRIHYPSSLSSLLLPLEKKIKQSLLTTVTFNTKAHFHIKKTSKLKMSYLFNYFQFAGLKVTG